MDVTTITQLVGSLGFPIVACCYLAWMHNDSETRHSEERKEMVDAINRNTMVMEIIKDILSADHDRFKRECLRAQEAGIKLLILIEEPLPEGGLKNWKAPRDAKGKPFSGVKGETLRRAMITMTAKYGVRFRFCDPKETGRAIVEYLTEGVLP